MRILLVEDNELLGDALVTALKQENYAVDWVRTGTLAMNAPFSAAFDVIVLDLGLPGIDGMSLLRQWRSKKLHTPILILTAREGTEVKVSGLDAGADDFLVKPFERDELMARLRSLLRRSRSADQADSQIIFGDIAIDTASHTVTYGGAVVNVSRREFAILQAILEKPGKVYTRDQLQQALYGWDEDVVSNTVEVYVHNLRKRLYPEVIKTLRGIGYVSGDSKLRNKNSS